MGGSLDSSLKRPVWRRSMELEPRCLATTSLTVIVPTYREADSLPHLVHRIQTVRQRHGFDLRLLLVDDDSRDGTEDLVDNFKLPWIRLLTRHGERGLSSAVLAGLRAARTDYIVVMDADLSHPPEKIPQLLAALEDGAEVAVGSRFAEGGSTADDWGPFRWLNSRIATFLALPLTQIKDPMSGFFAMRRGLSESAATLNPVGYKVLLELIVKCRCRRVVEVPIHFDNRRFGSSKLSLREQLQYFRHLRRLYTFRFGTWSNLAQFLTVGASGLAVNLASLTVLLELAIPRDPAIALAIGISMLWNFALNRRLSFSDARHQPVWNQLARYVAACLVGALVNYRVTTNLVSLTQLSQLAAVAGVLCGTFFNFAASRYLVFRGRHVKG